MIRRREFITLRSGGLAARGSRTAKSLAQRCGRNSEG
jgi:hypothetical protein